jgi:hypothetical protein
MLTRDLGFEAKDAFVRQAQLVYRLARDAEVAADARAAGKGA